MNTATAKNTEILFNGSHYYAIEPTHVNDIYPEDTIMVDGEMRTVCPKNIKEDNFMGRSIFGYNYKCGLEKVQRVVFYSKAIVDGKEIFKPYARFR